MFVIALVAMLNSKCDIADIDFAGQQLELEVANTAEEHKRGLMGVSELKSVDGMIFVFEQPRHVYFWMKDTPLPLDMLFFDASGELIKSHYGAKPFDLTPIDGGPNVQYVIELPSRSNQGSAKSSSQNIKLLSCRSRTNNSR